jgi:hypothetical protein
MVPAHGTIDTSSAAIRSAQEKLKGARFTTDAALFLIADFDLRFADSLHRNHTDCKSKIANRSSKIKEGAMLSA